MKTKSITLSTIFLVFVTSWTANSNEIYAQSIKQIDWNTSADDLRDRLDQDFSFVCPSGGSVNSVYGTDLYTTFSSICTAAVHSELINVRDGGRVSIRIQPGADFYNPSNRHNIKSQRYGNYSGSFVFLGANGQPLSSEKQVKLIEWDTSASEIRSRLDQDFTFDCPRNGVLNAVYGTGLYTAFSSICSSAVHQGIISNLVEVHGGGKEEENLIG